MNNIVESCRKLLEGREGDFLTVLLGNPALYIIPASAEASAVVDALAAHSPQHFVESVGLYLAEGVEVA